MNCRVSIQHAALEHEKLRSALGTVFGHEPLDAQAWKARSAKYRDLDGIEQEIIWGYEHQGDSLLFGFIRESADRTMVWIEHTGDAGWTCTQFKMVIERFVQATLRAQGRFKRVQLIDSSFYEGSNQDRALGLRVRLWTVMSGMWAYRLREWVVPGIAFLLTLSGKAILASDMSVDTTEAEQLVMLAAQALSSNAEVTGRFWDVLGRLDTYSDASFIALLSMGVFVLLQAGVQWWRQSVEVRIFA